MAFNHVKSVKVAPFVQQRALWNFPVGNTNGKKQKPANLSSQLIQYGQIILNGAVMWF